jgi:hypothetical protein
MLTRVTREMPKCAKARARKWRSIEPHLRLLRLGVGVRRRHGVPWSGRASPQDECRADNRPRATSTSSKGKVLSPTTCPCSWPLPQIRTTSFGRASSSA